MVKILGSVGAFIGSSIGWWVGAKVGMMTAFMLSILGTAAGIYFGRQVALKIGA